MDVYLVSMLNSFVAQTVSIWFANLPPNPVSIASFLKSMEKWKTTDFSTILSKNYIS